MSAQQLDDVKDQMARIRASLNREIETIRNNSRYCDDGRVQEIAKAVFNHRKQAQSLRDKFTTNNEDVRLRMTSRLFGLPAGSDAATTLVMRDAQDRAAKLESADDAAALLKRATELGDMLLARAVAGHAHAKKWNAVTESYAEAAGLSEALAELESLPSGGWLKTGVNVLFSVKTPPELLPNGGASVGFLQGADLPDDRLQAIAEGNELP